MQRRRFLVFMSSTPALADASGPQLAPCYERHMALLDGVAFGWMGSGLPARMRAGTRPRRLPVP